MCPGRRYVGYADTLVTCAVDGCVGYADRLGDGGCMIIYGATVGYGAGAGYVGDVGYAGYVGYRRDENGVNRVYGIRWNVKVIPDVIGVNRWINGLINANGKTGIMV